MRRRAFGLLVATVLLPAGGAGQTALQATPSPDSFTELPDPGTPRIPIRSEWTGPDGDPVEIEAHRGNLRQIGTSSTGPGPGTSFLASLLVPGSAQWMHGQDRTYLYLGLEAAGWIGFLHARHRGGEFRDRYRELAGSYALLDGAGGEFSGGFGYYETLGQYVSSGAWDADPTAEGLQPETDPETYNGRIWSLARELYFPEEEGGEDSEARHRALLYYQERAYPPEQAWDWSGNSEQMARYRDLIERSDDRFQRATVVLGAVVANHLLSAVDGFLSTRLSTDHALRLSSTPVHAGRSHDVRWTFELRLNPIP